MIFSAPSGSGKTTLLNHVMANIPEMAFSVSATTRPPRGEEVHGREYFFLSMEEFQQRVENGEFLEWEEVYPGRCYGTLLAVVEQMQEEGKHVAFDVDVCGGVNIKEHYGDKALSVFIQAPSVEELRRRLVLRGTDSEEDIEKRVAKAAEEMTYADKFDYVLVNDDLETALKEAEEVVDKFLDGH